MRPHSPCKHQAAPLSSSRSPDILSGLISPMESQQDPETTQTLPHSQGKTWTVKITWGEESAGEGGRELTGNPTVLRRQSRAGGDAGTLFKCYPLDC